MKKLMATKATDLTVGQSFQYLALLFAFIYAPLCAVCWIYTKVEEWKTEKSKICIRNPLVYEVDSEE